MIRVGIAGLDSSHCTAFTEILNRTSAEDNESAVRIVAGYPGGSPDFPLSRDRVAGFTEQMRNMGVSIVTSMEALMSDVDALILGSVDGRQHLSQAELLFQAGLPVFVDKPLAHSLCDALKIRNLGRRYGVPWFSASALRYQADLQTLLAEHTAGEIVGCDTFGQSQAASGHADLAWYGIHGTEVLYAFLGQGCLSITRLQTPRSEQVTGLWTEGRIGTYRGIREQTHKTGFGVTVFGTDAQVHLRFPATYEGLVGVICEFFRTRIPPVAEAEMIEVFTFIEAADESRRRGGIPVTLQSVLESAERGIA